MSIASMQCLGVLIDQPKQSSLVRAVKQCVEMQREVLESNPYVLASDDSSRAYPGDYISQRFRHRALVITKQEAL